MNEINIKLIKVEIIDLQASFSYLHHLHHHFPPYFELEDHEEELDHGGELGHADGKLGRGSPLSLLLQELHKHLHLNNIAKISQEFISNGITSFDGICYFP